MRSVVSTLLASIAAPLFDGLRDPAIYEWISLPPPGAYGVGMVFLPQDAAARADCEALVATAIGLLVALPAVATYNGLMRHVETAMAAANAVGHQILAYVKSQKSASSSGTREAK